YSAFPKSLDEISRVVDEGAIAFKVFLTAQIGGLNVDDDDALLRAFKKVGELKIPVAIHAEDKKIVETVKETEQKLGRSDVEAYLKAHSPEVEAKATERILKLAYKSDVQSHFCHISSKKAVTLIHDARKNGLRVSCETTPHHLLFTSEDLKRHGTILLTNPPMRSANIVEALWSAIKNAQIDIIASDHAPHLITEKTVDSVWDVKPGIPGLETLLPLLLTKVNEKLFTIHDLVRLTAEKPAEIFHFDGDGFLKKGYNANITVVDMHRRSKIDASKFYSKAKYSPFDGWQVRGVPVKTFVNGLLAMDEGEVVAEAGTGKILRGQA
ncbi:MAG: dihydroorotase family protein, partial [Candidatus Bathyarchaeia archaeon]